MGKTSTGEYIKYGILALGGILFLKAIGGIKGITDIFGSIGDIFGVGGQAAAGGGQIISPQEILTQTAQMEEQFQALTPAGQEYAQTITALETGEAALQQQWPLSYLYGLPGQIIDFTTPLEPITNWIRETISQKIEGAEQVAATQYMNNAMRNPEAITGGGGQRLTRPEVIEEVEKLETIPSGEQFYTTVFEQGGIRRL